METDIFDGVLGSLLQEISPLEAFHREERGRMREEPDQPCQFIFYLFFLWTIPFSPVTYLDQTRSRRKTIKKLTEPVPPFIV